MATGDALRALLASARGPLPPVVWDDPRDLTRLGAEAIVAAREGDARSLASEGSLRIHGPGVDGHRADLDKVGALAGLWQRAVTAVGASLNGYKSARGRISDDIIGRTRLMLSASPSPGSVVLNVEPRSHALDEVAPGGQRPMFDIPRPLADQASTTLLSVLSDIASVDLGNADAVGARLHELGPRVASTLHGMASVLVGSQFALEARWREPQAPSRSATWSVAQARWAKEFIEGRELDAEDEQITGLAITVSNRERWLIETAERPEKVAVAELSLEDVRRVRPGDLVTLHVVSTTRVQPDGTTHVRRQAVSVVEVQPAPEG